MNTKLFLIPLILTLLLIPNIFADYYPDDCIYDILCTNLYGLTDGDMIFPNYNVPDGSQEGMCRIYLNNTFTGKHRIDILKGDYSREVLYVTPTSPFILQNLPLTFSLNKTTSPAVVYCHNVYTTTPPVSGIENIELDLISHWSVTYAEQWFDMIQSSIMIPPVISTLQLTNIPTTYTQNVQNTTGTKFKVDENIYSTVTQPITTTGTITNTNAGVITATIQGGSTSLKIDNPTGAVFDVNNSGTITNNVSGIDANVTLDGNVVIPTYSSITTAYTNYPANNSNPIILAIAWLFTLIGFLGLLLILVAVDKEWF